MISEPPSRAEVNQPFGMSVAIEDAFGNLETTFAGSVSVALASGPVGSKLGGIFTAQAEDGIAVFSLLTVDRIGSGYSIKATSISGLATAKTSVFNVISQAQKSAEEARLFRAASNFKLHEAELRAKHRK